MINRSMPKTYVPKFYETFGQKKGWKIVSSDAVPTMDNQADTKETKVSP